MRVLVFRERERESLQWWMMWGLSEKFFHMCPFQVPTQVWLALGHASCAYVGESHGVPWFPLNPILIFCFCCCKCGPTVLHLQIMPLAATAALHCGGCPAYLGSFVFLKRCLSFLLFFFKRVLSSFLYFLELWINWEPVGLGMCVHPDHWLWQVEPLYLGLEDLQPIAFGDHPFRDKSFDHTMLLVMCVGSYLFTANHLSTFLGFIF